MDKQIYFFPKNSHLDKDYERIIKELQVNRSAICTNGNAVKVLSRHFGELTEKEKIYFSYCKRHRYSIITMNPDWELEQIKGRKVRIKRRKP